MVNYQIDDLDRQIVRELSKDARIPFVEIADKLKVSNGTVHQRVSKMKAAGILKAFQPVIDSSQVGFNVSAFIGIHLKNAKDCNRVIDRLKQMSEVVEAHYTTGSYALMVKVITADIQTFYKFLMEDLQSIADIQSTESFMLLNSPILRQVKI